MESAEPVRLAVAMKGNAGWSGGLAVLAAILLFLSCSTTPRTTVTEPPVNDPMAALRATIVRAANSIKAEVASFRGKPFKRQVSVSVLTRSEYAAMVEGQGSGPSLSDRNFWNSIWRLEGLLRPSQDYFASNDSTMSNETEGFYVPGTDSMYIVLGDSATGLVFDDSVTIFHEFVHALQDQYFDLTTFNSDQAPSDVYFAGDYVVEGEAELLENYYAYKLQYGSYPASAVPIVNQMNGDLLWADSLLGALHAAGEPMLANMPTLWEYYSYGPLFINAIAGRTWSIIDNQIFVSPPVRMLEIFHPSKYGPADEYEINSNALDSVITRSNYIESDDEFGELYADVMFKEWDFASFQDIANGIVVDDMVAFENLATDSPGLVWNTFWRDSTSADTFFSNYASLVGQKKKIQLPAAVDSTTFSFIDDTVNHVYIEQSSNHVFSIEGYRPSNRVELVAQCRLLSPVPYSSLAKRLAPVNGRPAALKKFMSYDQRARRFWLSHRHHRGRFLAG